MLLKTTDSWGPIGLVIAGILVGGAALLTVVIWFVRNLLRPKSSRKSWAGLGIFLALVAVVAIAAFIILA